jgi:hypothetical protein
MRVRVSHTAQDSAGEVPVLNLLTIYAVSTHRQDTFVLDKDFVLIDSHPTGWRV